MEYIVCLYEYLGQHLFGSHPGWRSALVVFGELVAVLLLPATSLHLEAAILNQVCLHLPIAFRLLALCCLPGTGLCLESSI